MSSSTAMCANNWRNSSTDFMDGDNVLFNDLDSEISDHINEPLERYLLDFDTRISLVYASASTVTATAGSTVCENSAGTLIEMRRNTSSTVISWADIDTGAEGNATYYVYAVADADATVATFKISLSSSAPSGVTLYKQVGSFVNASGDITKTSIAAPPYAPTPSDASGKPPISANYSYNTATSSFTEVTGGLKVAYGYIADAPIAGTAITNLPFTSSSTYSCVLGTAGFSRGTIVEPTCLNSSGSSMTVYGNHTDGVGYNRAAYWVAVGY